MEAKIFVFAFSQKFVAKITEIFAKQKVSGDFFKNGNVWTTFAKIYVGQEQMREAIRKISCFCKKLNSFREKKNV